MISWSKPSGRGGAAAPLCTLTHSARCASFTEPSPALDKTVHDLTTEKKIESSEAGTPRRPHPGLMSTHVTAGKYTRSMGVIRPGTVEVGPDAA